MFFRNRLSELVIPLLRISIMSFGDLSTDSGLAALNAHLSSRSFVEG
jgi:hypothetical protein